MGLDAGNGLLHEEAAEAGAAAAGTGDDAADGGFGVIVARGEEADVGGQFPFGGGGAGGRQFTEQVQRVLVFAVHFEEQALLFDDEDLGAEGEDAVEVLRGEFGKGELSPEQKGRFRRGGLVCCHRPTIMDRKSLFSQQEMHGH